MRPTTGLTQPTRSPSRDKRINTFKGFLRLATLLLLLPLAFRGPALAHAQAEIQLLGEDFQQKEARGWTLNEWRIGFDTSSTNYYLEGEGHSFAMLPDFIQVGDVPFRLRFQAMNLEGTLHVNFLQRGVAGGMDRVALDLSRYDRTTLTFTLWKQYTNPPGEILAEAKMEIISFNWYQFEIVYDSGWILVYAYPLWQEAPSVLPDPVIDVRDAKPLPPGGISFEVDGNYAAVDNVEVFAQSQPPSTAFLAGQVFEGEPGDMSRPLPGVTVSAFGANNPYPAEGDFLGGTTTNADGWYGLEVPAGYEFYSLRQTNLPGYESAGAESPFGKAPVPDWIEIIAPLEGKDLSRNNFWDRFQVVTEPPPVVTEPPVVVTEPPPPGPRYKECPPGEWLLMANDFEGGRSDGWGMDPGWQVVDGRLQGAGPAWAWYDSPGWETIRLQAVIELRAGYQGVALNTRLAPDRRYFLIFNQDGLVLGKQTAPQTLTELARRDLRVDTSVWHSVELVSMGDVLQGFLDGEMLFETRDRQQLPAGTVGLEVQDKGFAQVDQIWACGQFYTPPPVLPETPTPPPFIITTPLLRLTRTPPPTPTRSTGGGLTIVTQSPGGGGTTGLPPWVWPVLVGTGVAVGALFLFRAIRPPREPGEPDQGRRPPPFPGLPPIRLVNLWLTEGASGAGKLLDPHQTLVPGQSYNLNLQIQSREAEPRRRTPSAEQAQLQVVFYSPEADFRLESSSGALPLPTSGSTGVLTRPLSPQRSGRLQVRACVYYNNTLVQSAVLEVSSAAKGQAGGAEGIRRSIDYVASSRWNTLDQLLRPRLNIFANQTTDGSHWIGLFSADEKAASRLHQGDLHTFAPGQLSTLAEQTRQALLKIEGERLYRLGSQAPLEPSDVQRRAKDLAELACTGYILYDALFLSQTGGLEMERLEDLHALLQQPGLISIARCRDQAECLPWAALYSLPLDTNRLEDLSLCEVYQASLLAGDGSALLEQPENCRQNPACPLKGPQARYRVCPFGFWGVLHQIEQPIQKVTPTPAEQVPEELRSPNFEQSTRLERQPGKGMRLAMGAYPGMPQVEQHRQEIEALSPGDGLELAYETDRGLVLRLLGEGGRQVYYFYCHGDVETNLFRLRFGPAGAPGFISAADLDPFSMRWKEQPHPLVFLNGCETMASRPELIHGFLGKLRRLGALGVAGSEIKVWTDFARPFGFNVIRDLAGGCSAGEAFLNARRLFMQNGNPLGLVYSLHAPAALHLHDTQSCDWCRRSGVSKA